MSIFENMGPKEIAMCLSAFNEIRSKGIAAVVYYLPNRGRHVTVYQKDFDEGIKILRDDYDVFWTPDTKPDDLKWKINKRRMKELDEHIRKNTYIDTDIVCDRLAFGPGCVVTGNDYLYRRELGLPDNATVADILGRIRDIKEANENQAKHASKLTESIADVAKERDEADRLRRHWHAKYEDEHKECVRLSKLHAADKEKLNKQDAKIRDLSSQNTTLGYSVAALKKKIRSMEAEAAEKETKTKVITDTLRGNLVDSYSGGDFMTEWAKKELGALCERVNTVGETVSEVHKYIQQDPARFDEDPEHYLRLFTGLFEIANSAVEDCIILKVKCTDETDRDAFEELLEQMSPIAMMLSEVTKKLKREMGS